MVRKTNDDDGSAEEEDEYEEKEKKPKQQKKQEKKEKKEEEEGVRKQKETPMNFSLVDITKSPEERRKLWPRFEEAVALECEVKEGEMLFLPAGWFHNVTSFSAADADSSNNNRFHMAFNYWFHPPDATKYQQPYHSDFWETDWGNRGLS